MTPYEMLRFERARFVLGYKGRRMTLTIEQAYELPRKDDIRAMGFVIKLKELTAGSAEVKKLVDDYVS